MVPITVGADHHHTKAMLYRFLLVASLIVFMGCNASKTHLESGASSTGDGRELSSPPHGAATHPPYSAGQHKRTEVNTVAPQTIIALLKGDIDFLKKNGIPTAAKTGMTPEIKLKYANGHWTIVTGGRYSIVLDRGWTAMHLAAMGGHVDLVRYLKAKGLSIDAKTEVRKRTPLHYAVLAAGLHNGTKGILEVMSYLLTHGVNPNVEDDRGFTPLHYAAQNRVWAVVALLLENHADPNAHGLKGITPLHEAARSGCIRCAKLLLAAGADINATDSVRGQCRGRRYGSGNTPLLYALTSRKMEMFKFLVNKGANINAVDPWGNVPILSFAEIGDWDMVRLLISRGADVNKRGAQGMTVLHVAARKGNVDMVRLLLEHDANPNARTVYGDTPLHEAARHGQAEVVRVLLAMGADPDIVNARKKTPADVALTPSIRALLTRR